MQRDFSNLEDRIKDVQLTLGKVEEVEEQIKIVSNELKDLLKENQELAKKVEEILDMQ